MKFIHAFNLMKLGEKIKLPSWGGYWSWDERRKTIIMHCLNGRILEFREMLDVDYTISNICSDKWIIADSTNCFLLSGKADFSPQKPPVR